MKSYHSITVDSWPAPSVGVPVTVGVAPAAPVTLQSASIQSEIGKCSHLCKSKSLKVIKVSEI